MNSKKVERELKVLNARRFKLLAVLDKTESKRLSEAAAKLVGKCFKYHNSYSVDEKWWLYLKVVGCDGHKLIVEKFQTTSRGNSMIERDFQFLFGDAHLGDWYIPISDEEFDKAIKPIIRVIRSIK